MTSSLGSRQVEALDPWTSPPPGPPPAQALSLFQTPVTAKEEFPLAEGKTWGT